MENKNNTLIGQFEELTQITKDAIDKIKDLNTPVLVYEVYNGVPDEHHLFATVEDAEKYFIECLKKNADHLTESDIEDALEDGGYDNENGYEIIITHPTTHY